MENCQLYYSGKGILREDRCSKIILTVFSQKKRRKRKISFTEVFTRYIIMELSAWIPFLTYGR